MRVISSESPRTGVALTIAVAIGLTVALPIVRPTGAEGAAHAPTIPVSEIKPGMKGYGLTVFRGTEPEKFDVEVIDVLHDFRAGQDLILVKTPHPRLNVTKNVKGMSGSPIYLDGRLAGAYAYSWASFQVEPVAGVTPIAPMLTELTRPIPPGFWPLEGASPVGTSTKRPEPKHALYTRSPNAFRGEPGRYDLGAHARELASRWGEQGTSGAVPVATPLMLAGVGDRSAAHLATLLGPMGLEPMQAGGGSRHEGSAPEHYVDGGAVGVQMVRGDVSFMGLGTVTHVEGRKLCAFGHPMMSGGDSALPATIGRVLWIFASDQHSSKIGESVRPLGAMVQDRQSAIVVDETKTAPTFPVTIALHGVTGAPKTSWAIEVAEERFMAGAMMATALGSVLEATASERRDVTWVLRSKVQLRGHGAVELEDFGVGPAAGPDADDFGRSRLIRLVGEVLNNPWEHAHIERIDTTLDIRFARESVRLRGVDLESAVIDAGSKARVRLHLVAPFGGETTKVVEVPLGAEFAGKEVELEVLPGYEVSWEYASPENFPDLVAMARRQTYDAKTVVVQYKSPDGGVAFRGHVATRLPDFAVDTLRTAQTSVGPEPVTSWVRTVLPVDRFMEGRDKVKVKVRSVQR
ncbi:MAG: hypothetical protein U0169_11950 [Polyangiaceae bacterium]